jgi:hypothetical protein
MTVTDMPGSFVIVTDGALPDDLEEAFPGCTVEEFTLTNKEYALNIVVPDDASCRYYGVTVTSGSSPLWDGKISSPEIRAYLNEHPEIFCILRMERQVPVTAVWDGTFSASLLGETTKPDVTAFDGYTQEMEKLQALQANAYDTLVAAMESAEALESNNEDKCFTVSVGAELFPDLTQAVYSAVSATDGIGDVNSDGVVNALDAAEVLVYAAQAGSGVSKTTSYGFIWAGDFNADGETNSVDAAQILTYAAESGSGVA